MEKRRNDKWQSQHTEDSVYQEDWWLDEEDSEELPVFDPDEAEDYLNELREEKRYQRDVY